MKKATCVVTLLTAFLLMTGISQATTVTAWEEIFFLDSPQTTNTLTDIEMAWGSDDGQAGVAHNNATIFTYASINDQFGVWEAEDVSYTHRFDWLSSEPSKGTIISAQLEILAYGAQSTAVEEFDYVSIDGSDVGTLNTGNYNHTLLSSFIITDPLLLNAFGSDDLFSIFIDKDRNLATATDHINILSSKMTIIYDTAPVPTPASALLMGLGILGLAGIRKKN